MTNLQSEHDMLAEEAKRIPISILSGFLGSGKTTLLNHIMSAPEFQRTLVIINEFGEIGLDHDLMLHSSDDVVVEMSNGCVCCTLRRDLARTLREAPFRFSRGGAPWFDRVILETTGIADPAPIINTLMSDEKIARLYRLDGVIVMIDAVNGDATLDHQLEAVKQAAIADRLLLTKTDLADHAQVEKLKDRLSALNPGAMQMIAPHGEVARDALFTAGLYDPETKSLNVQNWLKAEAYRIGEDTLKARHGEAIDSISLTLDAPVEAEALAQWLDALKSLKSTEFLRMKGIINVKGKPIIIHGVQHIFHPMAELERWPSEDKRSRIVFITRGISAAKLDDTLGILKGADAPNDIS